MKKVSLYIMALLSTGLVSCNQDFETIFSPQTNEQESLLQTSDVSVANGTPTTINLADYINEETGIASSIPIGTASVKEGALPANTILKAEVEFSKDADFANSVVLDANSLDGSNEIAVSASLLQDAYFNNITRNPATTDLHVRTILYTVTGGTAVANVGKPGENFYAESTVKFTPLFKVQISPAYYVIGAAGGWDAAGARTQKFNHSDADVYDDPIFSIIIDSGGDDCWFAIGDDTALDAVNAGDWTQLLGVKGASEDLQGTMDFRYNLGGDHSFHVTDAKKIRITLNMMEYSYTIEPVNIAEAYYLIGGPSGDWAGTAASREQKFSHSNTDVFEDPVFTYVFEGNGGTGDIWFAFGDDETCDAINNGDWTKLFGYKGDFNLSGSFDRRYNLGEGVENSFHVDGSAKFYRVSINMSDLTYEISELNFGEYFYEIGNESGWATAHALYGAEGDGQYQGYYYLDGEFKFKPNEDNWDDDLEYVSGDTMNGSLQSSGGPNCPDPGAGFYRISLDAANLNYSLTKIEYVSIIGTANGNWDTDTDLTYNATEGCWEVTTDLNAGEMKFRGNHNWDGDVDLGGSFDNLVHGGSNIAVEAGNYTIKLYISIAGQHHAVVTKN